MNTGAKPRVVAESTQRPYLDIGFASTSTATKRLLKIVTSLPPLQPHNTCSPGYRWRVDSTTNAVHGFSCDCGLLFFDTHLRRHTQ